MTDWLIIADDLTGAADCGSAFVRHGYDAVVSWGDIDPDASILAIDADSRHLPPGAAAACQVAALAGHWRPGMRLYKKIDSTLRGQPAAELAAQLSAWGAPSGRARAARDHGAGVSGDWSRHGGRPDPAP